VLETYLQIQAQYASSTPFILGETATAGTCSWFFSHVLGEEGGTGAR
jgi:hypothetical protein